MKHRQIVQIPDQTLNEKLVPANDNYGLMFSSVELLEAESVLAPRICSKNRRNSPGLMTACSIAAVALILACLALVN